MAEAVGDPVATARALVSLSTLQLHPDPIASRPPIEQAIALATETGDDWALAHGICAHAYSYVVTDEFEEAERLLDSGLPIAERIGAEALMYYWVGYEWCAQSRRTPPGRSSTASRPSPLLARSASQSRRRSRTCSWAGSRPPRIGPRTHLPGCGERSTADRGRRRMGDAADPDRDRRRARRAGSGRRPPAARVDRRRRCGPGLQPVARADPAGEHAARRRGRRGGAGERGASARDRRARPEPIPDLRRPRGARPARGRARRLRRGGHAAALGAVRARENEPAPVPPADA